jgi:hypothetical protein
MYSITTTRKPLLVKESAHFPTRILNRHCYLDGFQMEPGEIHILKFYFKNSQKHQI